MTDKKTKLSLIMKKVSLLVIISLFVLLVIAGWKAVKAFYHTSSSLSVIASTVGDFDIGEGDINVIIYKKKDNKYVRINNVPAMAYTLNSVSCSTSCDTNSSSACHYSYNANTKQISITSNKQVTCKFYFDPSVTSDINVQILLEDFEGTYSYNSKSYKLSNIIPAYGYEYVAGTCENGVVPTFSAQTRKFTVVTGSPTTCYAYFDNLGNADIIVNVYVQKEYGENVYKYVEAIPANNTYVLSSSRTSSCTTKRGTAGATPTYTNGYIVVNSTEREECDVYLDLVN